MKWQLGLVLIGSVLCAPQVIAKPTKKVERKTPVLQWPRISRLNQNDYFYEISTLQGLLEFRGEKIKVDGEFGIQTELALKNFQRKHGLKADGIAGAQTLQKLIVPLKRGSKGQAVDIIQSAMTGENGENSEEFAKEPGVFGFETERAVRELQANDGLTVDGVMGPQTWCILLGGKVKK